MRLDEQNKCLQSEILRLKMEKEMLAHERDIHQYVPFTRSSLIHTFYMFTRGAYTKLAESLSISADPTGTTGLRPQTLPVALKAQEATIPSYDRPDFPSDFIWTRLDWKKAQEKPSMQLEKSHPLRFVVDKYNRPISLERVGAIRMTSRRVFIDIWNLGEKAKSWGTASGLASKMYYREMITFFPELGYCDNNWKCDAIATTSYASWRRNHLNRLIREGKYKPTAQEMVEFSNLETLDSDDIDEETTKPEVKKRTRVAPHLVPTSCKKQKCSAETPGAPITFIIYALVHPNSSLNSRTARAHKA
jgi:hypothetical protein